MKRTLFIIAIFMVVGLKANPTGKTLFNERLFIIPELGMNSSTLTKTSTRASIGFTAGIGLRIGKRKHLYTGIYYKAVRYEAELESPNSTFPGFKEVRSDYFVIPLMYGLTPIKSKLFRWRLFGGAAAFFMHQGKVTGAPDIPLSEMVWSMRAGTGINIWRVECNFTYDFGLTRMFETVSTGKNHGYNLTFGFAF